MKKNNKKTPNDAFSMYIRSYIDNHIIRSNTSFNLIDFKYKLIFQLKIKRGFLYACYTDSSIHCQLCRFTKYQYLSSS